MTRARIETRGALFPLPRHLIGGLSGILLYPTEITDNV